MEKRVIWSRKSLDELNKIHEYIFNVTKSGNIADKVIKQLFESANVLKKNNEIFPSDIYKTFNDGSYRAFQVFHYRISYKILDSEILILNVRHTSRNPQSH